MRGKLHLVLLTAIFGSLPALSQTTVTTSGPTTTGTVPVFGSTSNSTVTNSVITESGNNVGIGITNPANPLSVNGVISAGGTYIDVLAYNFNGTPTNGIKIVTNIPYSSGVEMPTLVIKGYDYGTSSPIGVLFNWYIYQGNFAQYAASSFGAYAPTIQLASEAGNVVIFINDISYFERFTIDAYAHGMSEQPSWFNGWSFADASVASDSTTSTPAANVVTLPYKNSITGTVQINSTVNSNSNQSNAVVYSNAYNTPGYLTGANGLVSLFGFQYANDVVHGGNYGGALSINSAYNGTIWSTWNGYVQPETLLVGSGPNGGNMGFHFLTSNGLNQNGAPGSYTPTEAMTVADAGNVGIGTSTPGSTLEVNGNVTLTSGSGASITYSDGTKQTTAWTGVVCGGDYAEDVETKGQRKQYEPGDVLVISGDSESDVEKSAEPYSTSVAGIYATKPGVIGKRESMAKVSDDIPMAMVGIVPTKVSAENGPIRRGDLLVTSSRQGYAMKGTDRNRLVGAVIGKAMGSLDSGMGIIEVLVTLQ